MKKIRSAKDQALDREAAKFMPMREAAAAILRDGAMPIFQSQVGMATVNPRAFSLWKNYGGSYRQASQDDDHGAAARARLLALLGG